MLNPRRIRVIIVRSSCEIDDVFCSCLYTVHTLPIDISCKDVYNHKSITAYVRQNITVHAAIVAISFSKNSP